jgi:4-azaleucine resistance transporter AzlC
VNKRTLQAAFISSLPVMAGYTVLGFGFGILAQQRGFGVLWAIGMSLTIFSGTMQYVGVELLASCVGLITAFLTTLMVNARYLFYGVTMLEHYKGAGKKKPYMIFGLTDETYAIVCSGKSPEGTHYHSFCFLLTLFHHIYWIFGGVLGVLAGKYVPLEFKGVEFVMTALFITVFLDQWKSAEDHRPSIIGIGCSLLCLLILGAEKFLIPALILITVCLLVLRKFPKKEAAQ